MTTFRISETTTTDACDGITKHCNKKFPKILAYFLPFFGLSCHGCSLPVFPVDASCIVLPWVVISCVEFSGKSTSCAVESEVVVDLLESDCSVVSCRGVP